MQNNDEPIYVCDDIYHFWRQINPKTFNYDIDYKNKQSTTNEMCWLRLGFLTSYFPSFVLKDMVVCDVGSGNGIFVNNFKNRFKQLYGYDLSGESISKEFLYGNMWDLIFLTDVLEHFENIEDLFNIHWKYLFLSFPETPMEYTTQQQLSKWKHYKPNEHIWCLNTIGIIKWFQNHNCDIITTSNPEDLIRIPQNDCLVNITTMIVKNNKYI